LFSAHRAKPWWSSHGAGRVSRQRSRAARKDNESNASALESGTRTAAKPQGRKATEPARGAF
jgi:hypothetical protein